MEAYASKGMFDSLRIATTLLTNADGLARTADLGKDAIQRAVRVGQPRTQKRLRALVEVLNKVEPRFGSALVAYGWFRSEPLPGFSGQTAMQLVQARRTSALHKPHARTAMREADQVGAFEPITVVAYRTEIARVSDGTDPAALSKLGISVATLADPRRRDAKVVGSIPGTQQLAKDLKGQRYAGILVPSFAPHA